MKHALPSLDALKVFESAARQLSFSRAAQELCLTKGAVSYQIRRLEDALDCALFRRAVRQVYLTEAGQQLLQTTQPLFAELEQTLARIGNSDSGNEVLIGITTYVALRWLSPRLASFSDRNPDIPILMRHTVNDEDFKLPASLERLSKYPKNETISRESLPLLSSSPLDKFEVTANNWEQLLLPPINYQKNGDLPCLYQNFTRLLELVQMHAR